MFDGVEQAGPSYEVRVFLNNEHVDNSTPRTEEEGYAGSFHVYGYGQRVEPGHRALLPIEKNLIATDAIRRVLEGSNRLIVSVVTIPERAPRAAERVRVAFDQT